MKTLIFCTILFCVIVLPALGELTDADFDKIRLMVKKEVEEEIKPLKADIEKLKEDVARLNVRIAGIEGRIIGVEKRISYATNVTYGLMALIVVAVVVPAWQDKRYRDRERKINELTREIEGLKANYSKRR